MTATATAIEKIESAESKEKLAALDVYREALTLLESDTELSSKQNSALAEAMRILGFTTKELQADVSTLRNSKAIEKNIDSVDLDALDADNRANTKRIGDLQEEVRKLQININLNRYKSQGIGRMKGDLRRIKTANPRIWGAAIPEPVQAVSTLSSPKAVNPTQPPGLPNLMPADYLDR